jgi:hypothetical protein
MGAQARRAGGWLRAGLSEEGFEVAAFLPCAVPFPAQARARVPGTGRAAPALPACAAGA